MYKNKREKLGISPKMDIRLKYLLQNRTQIYIMILSEDDRAHHFDEKGRNCSGGKNYGKSRLQGFSPIHY